MSDIKNRIAKIKNQIIDTKIIREKLGFKDYDDIIDDFEVLITTIESQNSQIESLKAITELAVKSLQTISTGYYTGNDCMQGSLATLSEIERLQNG